MVCAQATLEVDVPLHAAYDAWADVTQHPRFLTGLSRVEPLHDRIWRFHGRSLSDMPTWDVRVAELAEDEHVTLHALTGPWDAILVLFERRGVERTAVTLVRDHEPETLPVPYLAPRVREDLHRFKLHAEAQHRLDPDAYDDAGRLSAQPRPVARPLLHTF